MSNMGRSQDLKISRKPHTGDVLPTRLTVLTTLKPTQRERPASNAYAPLGVTKKEAIAIYHGRA